MKRYPGIQSFDATRKHLFFGRERETKELFRLAVLNPIVVLFGKSGTGKTSLIQAGVTPLLHERWLHPVFLRLNQTQTPIPEQIHAILDEGEYLPYNTPNNLTLWDYCQAFEHNEGGNSFTPFFVLDQFEELFTLYADKPDEQKRFITQLAQVMNSTAPEGSRYTTPPKAHFLISIRSDYLYLLDRLSDQIPAILRTRYELYDLDIPNARQAIEQPALAQGEFDSPPFAYSTDALQNIIDELSQEQQSNTQTQVREVGGFQLQLLCQRIEEKVIAQYKDKDNELPPQKPLPQITITPQFYGGTDGIRQIIGEFYNSVLEKYPDRNTRHRIQQLVEQGLVSNGKRIILEAEQIKQTYQLSQADLDLLNKERLCRKEPRGNVWYYEISHDTLLKPIIAAYELRRDAEEKQRLSTEKAEADRKAKIAAEQAERDRQLRVAAENATKRAKLLALIAGIVALLAIGAGWYAFQQKAKADEQTSVAEKALEAVKVEQAKTEEQRIEAERQKKEADAQKDEANRQKTEVEKQKRTLEKALLEAQEKEKQRKAAEKAQKKAEAETKTEQRKNINIEISNIRQLIKVGDVEEAKIRLSKALQTAPNNPELKDLDKELNK